MASVRKCEGGPYTSCTWTTQDNDLVKQLPEGTRRYVNRLKAKFPKITSTKFKDCSFLLSDLELI